MGQGRFAPALDVFRAVLPHFTDDSERLLCAGNVGRAAGAVGDRQAFEEAWEQVWTSDEWEKLPSAGQALLELAHGASSLRDWSRAEKAAEAGRELAQKRSQGQVVILSDTVLDAARRKRGMETPAPTEEGADDTQDLAADLVRSLRGVSAR